MAKQKNDDLYYGSLFDVFGQEKVVSVQTDTINVVSLPLTNQPAPYSTSLLLNRLTELQKNEIIKLLRSGESNARSICEELINNHGASEKRYSTGKPDIFVDVCILIERQVNIGVCILIEKTPENRLYKWMV